MKPSSRITWFVETRGVTLSGAALSLHVSIPYPYAGLWALIANGNYSPGLAAELMSVLLSVDRDQAASEVALTLAAWQQAGYLERN
jgi:hypothetical protein